VQLPLRSISRNNDLAFKFGYIGSADNLLGLEQLPLQSISRIYARAGAVQNDQQLLK